jgi:hypothetical protein
VPLRIPTVERFSFVTYLTPVSSTFYAFGLIPTLAGTLAVSLLPDKLVLGETFALANRSLVELFRCPKLASETRCLALYESVFSVSIYAEYSCSDTSAFFYIFDLFNTEGSVILLS